jgi:ParB-like chromosome segregation protein Spo0J
VQVKTVKISELRPHPKNPRVHPDSAIEKLERSIKEFGWTNPILVSADGYILAGHARLKAAEKPASVKCRLFICRLKVQRRRRIL